MAPPVPSRPLGIRLLENPSPTATVIELFQDLACPFSRKMMTTLTAEGGALDQVAASPSLNIEFVFHNLPQPWHPQSPVMHECMFAVALAVDYDTKLLLTYLKAAYEAFPKFQDKYSRDKSRVEIHAMCADIAAQALGEKYDGGADAIRAKVLSHLSFDHLTDEEPNMGLGAVTQQLKFAIKHHRLRGVHVTPTVFINSIEAPDISSGWTTDQWMEKLRSI